MLHTLRFLIFRAAWVWALLCLIPPSTLTHFPLTLPASCRTSCGSPCSFGLDFIDILDRHGAALARFTELWTCLNLHTQCARVCRKDGCRLGSKPFIVSQDLVRKEADIFGMFQSHWGTSEFKINSSCSLSKQSRVRAFSGAFDCVTEFTLLHGHGNWSSHILYPVHWKISSGWSLDTLNTTNRNYTDFVLRARREKFSIWSALAGFCSASSL